MLKVLIRRAQAASNEYPQHMYPAENKFLFICNFLPTGSYPPNPSYPIFFFSKCQIYYVHPK